MRPLQAVQSAAARLITGTSSRRDHITPVLRQLPSVVKVRGPVWLSPLLRFEPPAIVRAPLIESIKCFYAQITPNYLGVEWVWGLLQLGFVR